MWTTYDGTYVHVLFFARKSDFGSFEEAYYAKYDPSADDFISADGTVLSTPADENSLVNANSRFKDKNKSLGSALQVVNDTPYIAFTHEDGSGNLDLKFVTWTGSSWQESTVYNDLPDNTQWNGQRLGIEVNTSNTDEISIYESIWNWSGTDNIFGRFDSTDGGQSWSSRQTEKDLSDLPNGFNFFTKVRNPDTDLEWLASETTTTKAGDSGSSKLFAMDSSFRFVSKTTSSCSSSPSSVIDDFNDGDLSEYSGDTGSFSVVSSPTYEGDYALEAQTNESILAITDDSISKSQGVTLEYRQRAISDTDAGFIYFKQSNELSGYFLNIQVDTGTMRFRRFDNGSVTLLDSKSVSIPSDEWLRNRVTTDTNGNHAWVLRDSGCNKLGEISLSDSTYTSGGIQWRVWETSRFDYLVEI